MASPLSATSSRQPGPSVIFMLNGGVDSTLSPPLDAVSKVQSAWLKRPSVIGHSNPDPPATFAEPLLLLLLLRILFKLQSTTKEPPLNLLPAIGGTTLAAPGIRRRSRGQLEPGEQKKQKNTGGYQDG